MAADRYLFPVLAPDVRRDFGFSLADTGLLSTIFTLGLGMGGLPTGFLLSHFSRKTVMLLGISIFSAGTALTTVATGFWSMLFCLAIDRHRHGHAGDEHVCAGGGLFRADTGRRRSARSISVTASADFWDRSLRPRCLLAYRTLACPDAGFGAFGFLMVG